MASIRDCNRWNCLSWLLLLLFISLLFVCAKASNTEVGHSAEPKPSSSVCNTSTWTDVNIPVSNPSVREPIGGTAGSICNKTYVIVEDILLRCEKRYCCADVCNCENTTLSEQPCMVTPPRLVPVELICLVQHKEMRFYKKVCCDGFEEVDKFCYPKINCDVDGGGCDQDCVKGNTSHSCTCTPGFHLHNRTKCIKITTTSAPTTTVTQTSTVPTTLTSQIPTGMNTTLTTSTTPEPASVSTTTTTLQPTTVSTTPLPPITKTMLTAKTEPQSSTASTTSMPTPPAELPSIPTLKDISTLPASTIPTTHIRPSSTVPSLPSSTLTTSPEPKTTTAGPDFGSAVGSKERQGPAVWMLVVFPLFAFVLVGCVLYMVVCRKKKANYVRHDDQEPSLRYDNETYGRTGPPGRAATSMDVILPVKASRDKKKSNHPHINKVMDSSSAIVIEKPPKGVTIIESNSTHYSKEPKVMYSNYITDDDDGYLVASPSYDSGLPPPYEEEENHYEPVGEGAVGGAPPIPMKHPLQGARTAEIENTLNDNLEDIYHEIP